MTKRPWRTILRSLVVTMVALALSLMMFATASAAPATAQPSTTSAASNAGCYVLVVHLNGNSPATSSCLLQAKPAMNGAVRPLIATHPCGDNLPSPWVALYQDINFGGAQICFVGTGSVNLSNYTLGCTLFICTQWNNQTSSINIGANGQLSTDYNGNGNHCTLFVGKRSNNISQALPNGCGSGWNDAARWLSITS